MADIFNTYYKHAHLYSQGRLCHFLLILTPVRMALPFPYGTEARVLEMAIAMPVSMTHLKLHSLLASTTPLKESAPDF